jgi:hypothetical protein
LPYLIEIMSLHVLAWSMHYSKQQRTENKKITGGKKNEDHGCL